MPTPPGFNPPGFKPPGFNPPGFNPPGFGKPRGLDSWPFGEYYCTGCNKRVSATSTSCPWCGARFTNVDAMGRPLDEGRPGAGPGPNMPPGFNPGIPQPPIPNPGFGPGNGGAPFNPPAIPNIGGAPNVGAAPPNVGGPAPNIVVPQPDVGAAPNVGGFNVPNNQPAANNPFFQNGNAGDSSDLTVVWILLGVFGSMGIVGAIIFVVVRSLNAY
jgi:hypothetical protein